ncbi:hypothetical protein A1D23_00955 [Chelonobacter oris]|uniref:Endonuclease/exonuclease/phosphatase domain-containing protein n=1 Tax=Chelonobacter oris TaxID=505317 RepID=A0A0A3AM46_9PAST|nr:endonuclease/exonuclease/phosphatase family protein [Chelonobacter oris]KGQ70411.1 hypothetical protein OA57_06070 [Chelonobacter oris]MDH3000430.1 hypothetical protein [Chelonobacter oris]
MFQKLKFVLVCGLGICALSANALDVATYNLKHGQGNDNVVDLARPTAIIADLGVDLVALQEMDLANDRTGFVNQPAKIAYDLSNTHQKGNWKSLAAPAIAFKGGHYGNAIIYNADKLTLKQYEVVSLPESENGDGARSAGIALFEIDGKPFQFIASHLTHRNEPTATGSYQLDEINLIERHLDKQLPTIFAADFNASIRPEDQHRNLTTMQKLPEKGWRIDSTLTGQSEPDKPWIIDYILSKNNDGLKVKESLILVNDATNLASDHYPVKVSYAVK